MEKQYYIIFNYDKKSKTLECFAHRLDVHGTPYLYTYVTSWDFRGFHVGKEFYRRTDVIWTPKLLKQMKDYYTKRRHGGFAKQILKHKVLMGAK